MSNLPAAMPRGRQSRELIHVRVRLIAAFTLLIAALIIVGLQGASRLGRLNAQTQEIFSKYWQKSKVSREAFRLSNLNNRITLLVFMLDDPEEIRRLLVQRAANTERISELVRLLEVGLEDPEEKRLLRAVQAGRMLYVSAYKRALAKLVTEGKRDEARRIMIHESRPLLVNYHDAWNDLYKYQTDAMATAMLKSKVDFATSRRQFLLLLGAAGFITLVIAGFTVRRTGREIAERQEAKLASIRLKAVVESSDDAIIGQDQNGLVISWNRGAEKIFGYTASEMVGTSIMRLIPAGREGEESEILAKMRRGESVEQLETLRQNKDGRLIDVSITVSPIMDVVGNVIGVSKVARDITERKLRETQMERLRTEHTIILNSIGEGVHWVDVDGRIKFENPASAKMLGYEVSELIGKPAHSTMHHTRADGTAYPQSDCCIYATLRDGVVRHVTDEVFWRKDGTSFAVEYICAPVHDQNGPSRGSVVVFTDITERKWSEAELEKVNKQLVGTSRQAGMAEVATSVLHNVGNVLNSVNVASSCVADSLKKSKSGNLSKLVELLQEHEKDLGDFFTNDPRGRQIPVYLAQLGQNLADEQANALQELAQLQKNIEHIKEIVTRQQGFAKTSGGTEAINLTELVEDALRMNSSGLVGHNIKVIKEFKDTPPLMAEKHKLLQILVNLVRNAAYACDAAHLRERTLTIRTTNGEDHVHITVSDNGVGILPGNLERIFSHGFTTKKDGHGFGLHSGALAAKEMGGSLTVHSAGPGQGAAFTLELPCLTREDSRE